MISPERREQPILKKMIPFSVQFPLDRNLMHELKKNISTIGGADGFVQIVNRWELPSRDVRVEGFAFQGLQIVDGKIEP